MNDALKDKVMNDLSVGNLYVCNRDIECGADCILKAGTLVQLSVDSGLSNINNAKEVCIRNMDVYFDKKIINDFSVKMTGHSVFGFISKFVDDNFTREYALEQEMSAENVVPEALVKLETYKSASHVVMSLGCVIAVVLLLIALLADISILKTAYVLVSLEATLLLAHIFFIRKYMSFAEDYNHVRRRYKAGRYHLWKGQTVSGR